LNRSVLIAVCLGGGLLGLLTGCGPAAKPTGSLRGSVTFNGTPIKDATIQLQSSQTGEAAASKVGDDGAYSFGAPITAGEYLVAILPVSKVPEPGAGGREPPQMPAERTDIPERYRITAKSGLKVDVKSGDNTFDAKLTP